MLQEGRFEAILGHLGAILGHLGPSGGRSWAILGPILGDLLRSWAGLGPSWGSSWAILGHLGAILGHLGPSWGGSWVILGPSWAIWGQDRELQHLQCIFGRPSSIFRLMFFNVHLPFFIWGARTTHMCQCCRSFFYFESKERFLSASYSLP